MPETILVTGAAGYIGSHLCEALLRRGDSVVGLDAFTTHYNPSRKHANVAAVRETAERLGAADRFTLTTGDARDPATLDRVLSSSDQGPIRKVVHLAARAGVRGAIDESRDYVSANLVATTEVLEACRRHSIGGGAGHLVIASSSTVYGSGPPGWDGPFSEDLAADQPLSVYGATKRGCELLAHAYSRLARMPITCLRFFGVVGPRVRSDLAAYSFTDAIWHGRPVTRFGDGTTARDYTYVGDIVAGILQALDRFERAAAGSVERGADFECINLGNDRPVRLNDYFDALGRLLDKPVLIQEAPEHPMDAKRTWADLRKARRLLAYQPTTPFEDALREVVDWYEREIVKSAPNQQRRKPVLDIYTQ